MTATMNSTNGKPQRKQLSDQIDRLDTIIDALADALPESVTDATREGTRQAMQGVLTELFTNPDVLARLRAALMSTPATVPQSTPVLSTNEATPEPKPSFFARLKSGIRGACQKVVEVLSAISHSVRASVTATKGRAISTASQVVATTRILRTMLPLSRYLGVAFGASIVVAVLSYALPHTASAVLSGLGGACTALSVQLGTWLKRYAHSLGFATNG